MSIYKIFNRVYGLLMINNGSIYLSGTCYEFSALKSGSSVHMPGI